MDLYKPPLMLTDWKYETVALPTELRRQILQKYILENNEQSLLL